MKIRSSLILGCVLATISINAFASTLTVWNYINRTVQVTACINNSGKTEGGWVKGCQTKVVDAYVTSTVPHKKFNWGGRALTSLKWVVSSGEEGKFTNPKFKEGAGSKCLKELNKGFNEAENAATVSIDFGSGISFTNTRANCSRGGLAK